MIARAITGGIVIALEATAAPFFIVGPERAGSTMLRLIVGHHPDVGHCEEMNYVTPVLGRIDDTASFAAYLEHHPEFLATGYNVDTSLSFAELARSFLEQRRALDGRPFVGATVHHDFDKLPILWPKARYIFLNRDPRDVARSCVRMGWCGTCWHGAGGWLEAQRMWDRLKATASADHVHEIRYEELVRRPEPVLESLCEFIGVTYTPEMLAIERDTTYERPSPRYAERWRRRASAREIGEVEARIGRAALIAAGYEPSGLPQRRVGVLARAGLALRDRLNRMRFRVARYGFPLWCAQLVARRLGSAFSRFREGVELRTQAIDRLHWQ